MMWQSYFQWWAMLILPCIFLSCNFDTEDASYANLIYIDSTDTREKILFKAAHVVPTDRQLQWQKKELTAFLHFGINTFTDKEWGDGQEDPKLFNPTNFDANQWVTVLKEAGFKQVILTAKHHDGFCLWPSQFTDHSVKSSIWKNGQGDVVKELADACVKQNMDLGLYLSPWDRHDLRYGTSAYNDYFKYQLRELLTNYGPISEVWFDGAVAEGPNGKKQIYNWPGYYELIRDLQPDATIAVMGPDVRWVGTESGYGRETEWSVIPIYDTSGCYEANVMDNIIRPDIKETEEDLAGLNQLRGAKALKWYPSEVDVSIRPGWFYHEAEDRYVKSPEKLLDIYFNSIGKNSTLLLNVPPNKEGLIAEKDATTLKVFNYSLIQIFSQNLIQKSNIVQQEFSLNHGPKKVLDNKSSTYWTPRTYNTTPYLSYEWDEPIWFNVLLLSEYIAKGQRVSKYQLEVYEQEEWVTKITGTTIGYKQLLRFPYIYTKKARLIFSESRLSPLISEVGFYQDLPHVQIDPPGKSFSDSIQIKLSTNNPVAKIYYSQNYTLPSASGHLYVEPLILTNSSPLLALAINPDDQSGFVRDELYSKSKFNVSLLTTPSPEYLNDGGIILSDGNKGDIDFKSKKWLGYFQEHLEVIFDLKTPTPIRSIHIHSLYLPGSNIFPPRSITVYGSDDKVKYNVLTQFSPGPSATGMVHMTLPNVNGSNRYLKFLIENQSAKDAPNGKWLFVSEIEIL